MRRLRRTKIIATLGPASSTPEQIARLFEAGADIFRINMSHTPHDVMHTFVTTIRAIETQYQRPVAIIADLQGPKLRIGSIAGDGALLEVGQTFIFDSDTVAGDNSRVYLPHTEILGSLKPGHRLLLDDGRIRLVVTEASVDRAVTRVELGGRLTSRKGVSVPDTEVPLSAMTPKDMSDLVAALDAGVDWIALSFVQRPEDVIEVRKYTRNKAGVLAKIEKPQALLRLDEIIEVSDAIMVARGDLGVELPLAQVPGIQKQITRSARRAGKPVIVATQMLESMISAAAPTRAEVSDVATAIFEGADAIMLSAESAAGQYPVEAVSMMNTIAEEVERDPTWHVTLQTHHTEPEMTGADAIAAASRQIAETLNLSAIVCWTGSGATALRVARERPQSHVIALTPNMSVGRRLALIWGTHCVVTEDAANLDDVVDRASRIAFSEGFAKAGQRIIVVAGVPLGTPGATNMLRIAIVGSDVDAGAMNG